MDNRSEAALRFFAEALAAHKKGDLARAETLYVQVLQADPRHADALHYLGLLHGQKGNPEAAVRLIGESVDIAPNPFAHLHLADSLQALGRLPEALAQYDKALAQKADLAPAWYGRGTALQDMGRLEEASDSYDRCLALTPDSAAALCDKGNILQQMGRPQDALPFYRKALVLQPSHAALHFNLAGLLNGLQQYDAALASFDAAIACEPRYADAFSGRGTVLQNLSRPADALDAYNRALALDSNHVAALYNRGIVLAQLGRPAEALASYDRALARNPDGAEIYYNRGNVLHDLNRKPEAIQSFERAIALRPNYAEAFYNRGIALYEMQRFEDALASYDAALAIDPTAGEAAGGAFNIVAFRCDWDERDKRAAVLTNLALGGHAVEPFNMIAAADNPEAQGKGAAANIARRTPPNPPWPRKPRPANPKIRLGYLSGDFHNHPVAHLTAPLFEAHDRGVFEILGFSSGPSNADPMRKRLEQSFDKLFDVHGLSDAQVAQGLAELNVDIAIDLSGHTKGSRTAALSYRPAPLAVNMLGFPGTTGAPYIDYIIADKRLIPESAQAFYAEKPVYLPESYMPNHAERKMGNASSRAEAGLPEQGFVFCAFNGSYKITREIFIVWMRLLQAVPHSVLWLNVSYDAAVERLRREAQARGVAAERLVFAPNLPDPGDHLARLQLADVFLDTDVYNAHATAADTLWAGVPVITCPGRSFAARVASSLVSAAGMPELAVTSRADYETLALQFAREPERLRAAKAKLIASRASAPLFDTQRYRGHLESAYRRMWERAQRGLPPESFAVS